MTNFFRIATVAFTLAAPALAQSAPEAGMPATGTDLISVATACPLSAEVVEGIVQLRSYGDRFQPAIDRIIEEAAKPDWTWGPACDAAVQLSQVSE